MRASGVWNRWQDRDQENAPQKQTCRYIEGIISPSDMICQKKQGTEENPDLDALWPRVSSRMLY